MCVHSTAVVHSLVLNKEEKMESTREGGRRRERGGGFPSGSLFPFNVNFVPR